MVCHEKNCWREKPLLQPDSRVDLLMLVIAPVIILFMSAAVITLMQRSRPGFGYSWLLAVSVALLVWFFMLAMRWVELEPVSLAVWQIGSSRAGNLRFRLDPQSWPYAFSLVSILVAVMLSAPARLQMQTSPSAWAGSLAVTAAGVLSVISDNPLTVALTWTGVDLIEVMLMLGSPAGRRLSLRTVAAFAGRVTGTMLIVWAMALSRSQGVSLISLEFVSPQVGLTLLLAAGLRLGVLPLYLPYSRELPMRRGLGTVLRFVSPAASLALLNHLPDLVIPYQWAVFLSGLTALAALYGAGMFLASRNELDGRPYWLIALASFAIACVVRGRSSPSLAWGTAMLLSGSLLFLHSFRYRFFFLLPLVGFIGLTGVPFTPSAFGWPGLVVFPFNLLDMIFIASHVLILLGYLRHTLRPETAAEITDRWVWVVYPVGMLLIVAAQWLIGVDGWPTAVSGDAWWAGLVSLGGAALLAAIFRGPFAGRPRGWMQVVRDRLGGPLGRVFRLDWAYQVIFGIYGMLERVVRLVVLVVDGDGGVLWLLLVLAILLSLTMIPGGVL
jgi:hypothetical protein